eukprot:1554907-Prymnesium_polylepis.1
MKRGGEHTALRIMLQGHFPPPVTRRPSRHPARPPALQSAARRAACAPPPGPAPCALAVPRAPVLTFSRTSRNVAHAKRRHV